MSKSVKFVATAAVVCLAGTCLAAPALAVEVGAGSSIASAAAEAAENAAAGDKAADTAAADEAGTADKTSDASAEKDAADASTDKDAATDEAKDAKVTLGGISYTAPAGYTAVTESDEGATYINADQTAAVVIYDLSYAETPDDSSAVDYYKSITEASVADYPDATVEDLGTENISGIQCQGFGIVITQDDSTYKMVQLYIPAQETGFTLVQLGYDTDSTSDADVTALTDFLSSIELASAATGDSSAGITTTGGAINFTLPAGLTEYAEGMWADEAGDILIQQADEVMFGVSQLTDSDYEEVFAQLDPTNESGATGQQISSGTVKGVDTEVRYASYSATVDGETVYYVVMMAPAADDSLTVVMAACTEKGSQEYGAALTEMMKTFDQA